jgi:hypothetical protein
VDGKLDSSILPSLALSTTFVVTSETEMLALSATNGNIAIRTDINKTFILKATPASVLTNWQELLSSAAITSVNGKTGTVTLTPSDVGAVPTTRNIGVGAGLTGGGTLDSDVTLGVNLTTSGGNNGTATTVARGDHTHANVIASGASGLMNGTDKAKLDGISAGANKTTSSTTNGNIKVDNVETIVYTHPSGDGNLHVPATGTTNNTKILKAGSTAGSIAWGVVDWTELSNKPTAFTPSTHTHAFTDITGSLTATQHGTQTDGTLHAIATASVNGFMSSTDKTKLDGIAANANNYVHPNHTGDVTSTGDGATVIANGAVTLSKMANMATSSIIGRITSGVGSPEILTPSQVRTILNVADGANNYIHPAGDGNLHVPATGTTSTNKVLMAGSTAGSLSWSFVDWNDIVNKPSTYALSTASSTVLGGVKIGANVNIDGTGVISVAAPYVHPAGDGNLHVPATSTINNNKVLKAGVTAGSISWGVVDWSEVTSKPTTLSGYGVTDACSTGLSNEIVHSTNDTIFSSKLVTDTNYRFELYMSGDMHWGIGTSLSDTNLYRSNIGELKTDGSFVASTSLTVNGAINYGKQSSAPIGVEGAMYYDTFTKVWNFHNGTSWAAFGSGTGGSVDATANYAWTGLHDFSNGITIGTDVNLYRSIANTLKTDDSVVIDKTLVVNGTGLGSLATIFNVANKFTITGDGTVTAGGGNWTVDASGVGDFYGSMMFHGGISIDSAGLTSSVDLETTVGGKGIVMKTPDGTKRYRVRIDNSGSLVTELI